MNLKAAGTTIILLLIYTMGPSSLAGSRSLRFHDLFYFKSEMYPSPMGNVEAREISAKPQAHPIFFYQNLPWTLPPAFNEALSEQKNSAALKAWNSDDKQRVEHAFQSILDHQELTQIFQFIGQQGKIPIRRFNKYPLPDINGTQACARTDKLSEDAAIMWVNTQPFLHIGLSDEYIRAYEEELKNGEDVITYISLHEIMHILDVKMRILTRSPQFLAATGWYQVGREEWKNKYIDYDRLDKVYEAFCNDDEETEQTLTELHDTVHSMGFPTMYSTVNPTEFFAEIAASYLLNNEDKKHLHKNFVWFLDRLFN